jgi:hypothetical protein
MNERELSSCVRAMIADRDLWCFTSHDFRHRTGPGFPDLVIIGPGGILHRELKTETGTISEEQRWVGKMINRHGGDYQVWRTSDLTGGLIASELDHLTKEPA